MGGGDVLPKEIISQVISMTSPRDSCRCSLVSTTFCSAAALDGVWNRFLPSDLPSILSQAVDPPVGCITKKDLYFRLCERSILVDDGKMSFSLERSSGGKCYMLSARSLEISWGANEHYWTWTFLPDSRFTEVAELLDVCWLDITGKIESDLLSQNTTYAAYLVFKVKERQSGFGDIPQQTVVRLGAHESKNNVCLESDRNNRAEGAMNNVRYPRRRDDGWMEIEMGEFYNDEGCDGEVMMSLTEHGGHWKRGIVIQGMEVRPKN